MDRIAAISIGSNLGDRRAHVEFACGRLQQLLREPSFSSLYDTDPVGVADSQPRYLNAAAVGRTDATARELLQILQRIEAEGGRERPFRNAPRTLDLDLILLGDLVIDEPALIVPHPRFRERRFVLEPLVEIGPTLRDPVSGQTILDLWNGLGRA